MKVLVTGANGFIGQNLVLRMREQVGIEVLTYLRGQNVNDLHALLDQADVVVHLAGENRPSRIEAYAQVNTALTQQICECLCALGKTTKVIFASSIQAEFDNPYGRSKLAAEQALRKLSTEHAKPVAIYRLPGVFGKWCKPNYNSVVATFCYNKAYDLPVQINNPRARVRLVYVDDVVNAFLRQLAEDWTGLKYPPIEHEYSISLGELSEQIDAFKNCRGSLVSERVGKGLIRALYATYISYLPTERFSYDLPVHADARGIFVEMLKTPDTGQFSVFTTHPGFTRGEHYHHTKSEKFLVIRGKARFGFRHILTQEVLHIDTQGSKPQIVESVPGWVHNITNIGTDEMVVVVWANEIFDHNNPDTIVSKV